MSKFVGTRTKEVGFLDMAKKWDNLGTPRNKVSGKSGSISKQDARGEGKRTF